MDLKQFEHAKLACANVVMLTPDSQVSVLGLMVATCLAGGAAAWFRPVRPPLWSKRRLRRARRSSASSARATRRWNAGTACRPPATG
jgi:hypothetical protein